MSNDKKFIVEVICPLGGSIEVPLFAESLDEAVTLADIEYTEQGFGVGRIRPEVKHEQIS